MKKEKKSRTRNAQVADTSSQPEKPKEEQTTVLSAAESKPESSEQLPYTEADFEKFTDFKEGLAALGNAFVQLVITENVKLRNDLAEYMQAGKVAPVGSNPTKSDDLGDLTKILDHPVASKLINAASTALEKVDLTRMFSGEQEGFFGSIDKQMKEDLAGVAKNYYEKRSKLLDAFIGAVEAGKVTYETREEPKT